MTASTSASNAATGNVSGRTSESSSHDGRAAHGGQIAQVHGHGAAADLGRRAPAQVEVHAVDDRVSGLHEAGAAGGAQNGGIVADADDHLGAGRRQVLAKPLEQRVFSAFADRHR